jgi:uncharacterized protein YndB with AHSA1/START domain
MNTQKKTSGARGGNSLAPEPEERALVITRGFDAPRSLVYKAWTDPEHVVHWWGPKGFTTPFCKIDFRPGGVFHYCMRSPEGKDYWNTGVYREILPLERIVCTDSFADEKGNVVPATYYGMSAEFPLEMLQTVTFEEHEGKTTLTLRHVGIPTAEIDSCNAGWTESLDRLAEYLANALSRAKEPGAQAARAA